MCLENLKCIALAVPEIIAIGVLVGIVNPNLGEEDVVGVTDGTIRMTVGDFLYAVHSNFSSILTRFREIAAFVLQHATFPTPPLVSPKFLHVSLGVGG